MVIIAGANTDIQFIFFGLKNLRSSELSTTDTELIAIANHANSGLSVNQYFARIPPAIGIHNVL